MNLQEFEDAVVVGDLTQEAVIKKWKKLCSVLSKLDVEIISELIHEGCLQPLVDFESDDMFGTKGLNL